MVTAEALYRLTGGRIRRSRRAFEFVRLHVESIASRKYDGGFVEADGSITITPADLGLGA
jgi:hypothetical protein